MLYTSDERSENHHNLSVVSELAFKITLYCELFDVCGCVGLKAAQIPPEAKKGAEKVESAFAKDETTLKGMGFAGP